MPIVIAIIALLAVAGLVRFGQTGGGLAAIGDFGTAIARPIFIPLVNLINEPSFVYIASLLIFLSAVLLLVVYDIKIIRPQIKAMRRATFAIGALPDSARSLWQSGVQDIEAVLTREGVLLSAWVTYIEDARHSGKPPSRRFSLYGLDDQARQASRHSTFLAAAPGYYTSVGLIVTFVGLVVALYFAAKGFRSGDLTEARLAIVQLLNASAFKFMTSVAALFSALMISVAYRLMLSRLRRTSHALMNSVDIHLQGLDTSTETPVALSSGDQMLADKLDRVIAELVATRQALARLATTPEKG
jgi:hypothetical protein